MSLIEKINERELLTITEAYVALGDRDMKAEPCDLPDRKPCSYKGKERLCNYPGGKFQTEEGLKVVSGVVVCPRYSDIVDPQIFELNKLVPVTAHPRGIRQLIVLNGA